MQLAAAGGAVRADLVVEAHDLVAVVGPEEHQIAGVRLPDESLDGARERGLRPVRLQRIAAANIDHRALSNQRAPLRAFDADILSVDGADENDAGGCDALGVDYVSSRD